MFKPKHVEGDFRGQRNYLIYYQGWLPENGLQAILLVVHGLAEHGGRYRKLAEHFTPQGYGVFVPDLQGHGKSQGKPGYVASFRDYLADLETFYGILRETYPDTPLILLGHSLGGTIAAAYAIRHQDELKGLVLSGAIFKPGESVNKLTVMAAQLLSRLAPRAGVNIITPDYLSRDKTVVAAYRNDPLVYHGKISYRLGAEILRAMGEIQQGMSRISLPVLIMCGGADRLCNPKGSEMLFEGIHSPDRVIKQYQGLYHEIFNEPECETVFADLENWLDRISALRPALPREQTLPQY